MSLAATSTDYRVGLEKSLWKSELRPVHVEVVNDSTWYYMRSRLGPKRQAFYNIKYNESHLYHEAYVYQLVRREEDFNVVPKKVMVGHAQDRWKAHKMCEKAIRERDYDARAVTRDMMEKGTKVNLDTHFRLLIVSDAFVRVSPVDRIALVWQELLSIMGRRPKASDSDLSTCAASRMKHFCTFGVNVLSLDLFTFVPNPSTREVVFQIKAITPAQWKPNIYPAVLSERLGKDHQQLGTLGVHEAVRPTRQKKRVQKLTTSISHSTLPAGSERVSMLSVSSRPSTSPADEAIVEQSVAEGSDTSDSMAQQIQHVQPELAETLGLHESVSGIRYSKLGGIYGHFFNDLSSDIRAMVLERYQSNKGLIRLESHADPNAPRDITKIVLEEDLSFQPKTNLSIQRAKARADTNLLAPDRGTANQDEMKEEVLLSARKIELLAIRLQRIRRGHMLVRARRRLWWRYWACIAIQRFVRGWFGRRFARLFQRLQPVAAMRIQSFYRNLRTNRVLFKWHFMSYRMSRVVLRLIKKFFLQCYRSWVAKRDRNATIVQSIVRVRLAVSLKYHLLGLHHLRMEAFPRSATKIQCLIRGFLGRKKFLRHLDTELRRRVDDPAALRLQRIFRGRLAKRLLAQKKREQAAAVCIQKLIRYFVRMCGVARMKRAALEIRSATLIQKVVRGRMDRGIYALMVHQRWYSTVYIPSVVCLQAWMRGAFVRKWYFVLRRNNGAAKIIQRSFRFQKTRFLAKLQRQHIVATRREVKVTLMQACVRRFLYQRRFRRRLLSFRGKMVFAAKLIARAWRSYKLQQKYQELLDEVKRESDLLAIKRLFAVRQGILKDIREIQGDIRHLEKNKERIGERSAQIKEFMAQASLRMVSIKREIDLLTVEDYERGWAEGLGQEYEYMLQQHLMSREEQRLLNHRSFKIEEEKVALQIEIEENEVELDFVEQMLRQTAHKAHRRELSTADRKAHVAMHKRVFREKVHWKIDSNRRLKMLRTRERYQQIIQETKASRGMQHAATVSFEKRAQRDDYEKLLEERLLMEEASRRDLAAKPRTYEDYAVPVIQTYDRIVARNLGILRGVALDDRARSLKDYFFQKKTEAKKLRRGQFAALKPEFEGQNRPKLA